MAEEAAIGVAIGVATAAGVEPSSSRMEHVPVTMHPGSEGPSC